MSVSHGRKARNDRLSRTALTDLTPLKQKNNNQKTEENVGPECCGILASFVTQLKSRSYSVQASVPPSRGQGSEGVIRPSTHCPKMSQLLETARRGVIRMQASLPCCCHGDRGRSTASALAPMSPAEAIWRGMRPRFPPALRGSSSLLQDVGFFSALVISPL